MHVQTEADMGPPTRPLVPQLSRLLKSPLFAQSARRSRALRYIVEEILA